MNGNSDDTFYESGSESKTTIRSKQPHIPQQQRQNKQHKAGNTGSIVKKSLIVLGVSLLGLILGSGVGIASYMGMIPSVAGGSEVFTGDPGSTEQLSNRVTFLLIGVDQRPDQKHQGYLADSIILASADPDTKIISLMSIPRDSEVLGHVKINSVPSTRGMDTMVNLVSEITGVKIDGYIKTNFGGFKDIIDILGGIDIYVDKDMYKLTGDEEDGIIDLKKGQQRLDGDRALQYARFRSDPLGDITRTGRQQKVIMAMAREALKPGLIGKLPQLVPQVLKSVETNLKTAELLKLAGMAKNFKSENMVSATMPGFFLNDEYKISFWKIDEASAKKVVANLLKGITTNKVVIGEINQVPVEDGDDDLPPQKPPDDPDDPDDPGEMVMKNYVGEDYKGVEAELRGQGFKVTSSPQESEDHPKGAIISTNPAAGAKITTKTPITIIYSNGPGTEP
ncbi:MAG: LCP family protein [Peptococcaceae bacterium]|nr:LCP family protein [Peptococcaceae bacterium]